MNKLIKELELRHTTDITKQVWDEEAHCFYPTQSSELDVEAFANSIIKACIEAAQPNYMSVPSDSAFYVDAAIARIKNRFGIRD